MTDSEWMILSMELDVRYGDNEDAMELGCTTSEAVYHLIASQSSLLGSIQWAVMMIGGKSVCDVASDERPLLVRAGLVMYMF